MENKVLKAAQYVVERKENNYGMLKQNLILNNQRVGEIMDALKDKNRLVFSINANILCPEGVMGTHLSDIFKKLLKYTNGNQEQAENSIVIIDEFEKFSSRDRYLDVFKADIPEDQIPAKRDREKLRRLLLQTELAGIVKGKRLPVEYAGRVYNFNTSRLAVIGNGNFPDLKRPDVTFEDLAREGYLFELTENFLLNPVETYEEHLQAMK